MNKGMIAAGLWAAAGLLAVGAAVAQGAAAPSGGAPAASAPGPGMGPGPRGGGPHGMKRPPKWGPTNTPGWGLMSPAERDEHRAKMREMKSVDECKAYVEQHHAQMAERAKAQGGKPLPAPRRDPCRWLKP